MDQGWIKIFASQEMMYPQISVSLEGGNTIDITDFSIEVDNVDELSEKAKY